MNFLTFLATIDRLNLATTFASSPPIGRTNKGRPAAKSGVGVANGNDEGSQLSKPITAKLGMEFLSEAYTKHPKDEGQISRA
jgi:hypothetical protein